MMQQYQWYPFMGGWGFMGGGFIYTVLFWALVGLLIVVLIKGAKHDGHWEHHEGHTEDSKKPLDILKERYAKGEVSKKEYEEMKKDLE